MIVCKKPCTIYDVDVIGVVALIAVGVAACLGVVIPATADASEFRALSAKIAQANSKTEQTGVRLSKVDLQIEELQRGVDEQTRLAPKPGALSPFLQRVASVAEGCNLRIHRVLPQPGQRADGYAIGDIRFSGAGSSLDFVRLLDQLARDNPYYALRDFSIRRSADSTDPGCALSWTLRLYMLDDESLDDAGETP